MFDSNVQDVRWFHFRYLPETERPRLRGLAQGRDREPLYAVTNRDKTGYPQTELRASFRGSFMKQLISKLLLLVYLLPTLAVGQSPVESQIKRVEQGLLPAVLIKGDPSWSITERMKHYKVPGLSIAVIKDFKVEWARAYGLKDIESNEPVSTDTLFQAGSISKSVAAMVAMKKVEEGKISLDENINNKLVSWKLPDNDFTAK